MTRRDQHEQFMTQPACAACHRLIDPLGYSLEHFDVAGDYRDLDNGIEVDASGEYSNASGISYRFTDTTDLAPQLAVSCEVARQRSADPEPSTGERSSSGLRARELLVVCAR